MNRIIGEIKGEKPGPLIILMGSLHGNETAGIKAIEKVFKKIQHEKLPVRGRLIGMRGNIQAFKAKKGLSTMT
jgi:succinylglutamate desuccinylase